MGASVSTTPLNSVSSLDKCGYMHEEVVKLPMAVIRLKTNVDNAGGEGGEKREREREFPAYGGWLTLPLHCKVQPNTNHLHSHS